MTSYKAVIVNYNKSEAIKSLLEQLNRQSLPPTSVAVIDNSPISTLLESDLGRFPFPVELQHRPENLGYSKACNLGASGHWDHVVFLNPDIEIADSNLFQVLLPQITGIADLGCAGVAQRNPDGSYERVARKFPSITAILGKRIPILRSLFAESVSEYLESYSCGFDNKNCAPLSVDWLQSSFLLVPRTVWQEIGGFDERFFVFMADTEYGLRCRAHGLSSYLYRNLQVHADGVRSSAGGVGDILKKKTIRIHIRDALRYYTGL